MCTNRFIISLAALGVVLGVQAQETVTQRFAGRELTDTEHSEQTIALPVDPQSTDSLLEVRSLDVNTYIDTLRSITKREETIVTAADTVTHKGHYVEIHAGAGIGSVGYGWLRQDLQHATAKGHERAALSGVVQLQYAYFFHENVGVGIGAWLSNYTSHGYLSNELVYNGLKQENGKYVPDYTSTVKDNDGKGEYYNHHVAIHSWHERQTLHTVGVPITLQFQTWGKKNKAGFFAALGAAPTYTVKTNYRVLDGEIEHWGAYLHRDAELHNVHDFGSVSYDGQVGKLSVKSFSATALVDLGLLLKMSKHTDFLLGIYGHYTFLDMQDATPTDLGWASDKFTYLNAPEYNGILATNMLKNNGALHPWQAGVKIGVHWHSVDKPRTTTVLLSDTTLQTVERRDSVWTSRIDTLQRKIPTRQQIQREIDRLNRIYFSFDSYEINDESKQMLQQIAEQLKTVPNKILIGGHASKEGLRSHNARLAKQRALTVMNYLIDCGVPKDRLTYKGYGSDVENAINVNHELSLDRRVEIIVLDE